MSNDRPAAEPSPKKVVEPAPRSERRGVVWIPVILASLLIPFMIVAFWIKYTLLDTENYLALVGPLTYDPTVATAMAEYATTQLWQPDRIEAAISNALPVNAQFLVPALANNLQQFTETQIYRTVTSEAFNRLWVEANRVAQQRIANLLQGDSQALTLANGQVTLDVGQAIEAVRTNLGREGLGIVEQYAPQLAERQIVLLQAPRLAAWQPYVALAEQLVFLLPILIAILLGVALWLSPIKRATLFKIGIGIGVATILLVLAISAGRTWYLNQSMRQPVTPEVAAVLFDTITQPLVNNTLLLFLLSLLTVIGVTYAPKTRT